jgi:hypothetical protein
MTVVPFRLDAPPGPSYITLKEAMKGHMVSVLEVNQGGCVPELKVINGADVSVLLLDGEELVGAKQNRVLNTSILLRAESEGVIPVSCTEHGRWSYMSAEFAASDALMSPALRSRKVRSVSASLQAERQYASDQRDVWDSVAELSAAMRVPSPTGAMHDVYRAKESDLEAYLKAFAAVDGQKGLLVMIGGKAVGFDLVSRPEAYAQLHGKLVRSYAMDALLSKDKKGMEPSANPAKAFLKEAAACEGKAHKSVGHGWDHRFEGKAIVGSALVYRQTVIHAAFFRAGEDDKAGRMSSATSRRRFRL